MKAFATDLDGTLVFDRKVKDIDKEAIHMFQKDNLFGVCTGRPVCSLFDIEDIPFDFYIVSSGALLLDRNKEMIAEHIIDKNLARDIFNYYVNKATIIVQTNDLHHFYATGVYNNPLLTLINSFEDIGDLKVYSISLVFDTNEEAASYVLDVNERYPLLSGYQNNNSIDIVVKGVSKGTGVKAMKKHLNADEMFGIGDSYNDLPLFKASDHSFTFHSSPESVKEEVNDVVDSVSEAIYKVL